MKTLVGLALLLSTAAPSFASTLNGDSTANDWNRASRTERVTWTTKAVSLMNTRSSYQFSSDEVFSCLNALYLPPVSKGVANTTLGEAAVSCMMMLKK